MKIRAWEIDSLLAGTRIVIQGQEYIRMADKPIADGMLCHLRSGDWKNWDAIVLGTDKVEVLYQPYWLTTEDAMLKLHYPEGGVAAVQKAGVKRSKQSIQHRARRLGIKSTFHWRRDWN